MEDNNLIRNNSFTSEDLNLLNQNSIKSSYLPPNVNVEPCKIEFFYEKFNQCYQMFKNPRGECIIVNIYQIAGMPPRRWSDRDTDALKQLFEQLLFNVHVYTDFTHDLTSQNLKKILKEFSELKAHEKAQCCVVCLMSHGEEGFLTTREGDKLLLDDIFTMFNNINCPNLAGKPKLFFIQSCRDDPINGPAEDLGIRLSLNLAQTTSEEEKQEHQLKHETDSNCDNNAQLNANIDENGKYSANDLKCFQSNNSSIGNKTVYHIPSFCDMLIGYPTQKGFIAYRKPEIGSWYMNAIVQVFSKHSHDTDLCAMLNMVNSMISNEVTNTGKKQMSEYTSKLTKPYFYFFPGLATDAVDEQSCEHLNDQQIPTCLDSNNYLTGYGTLVDHHQTDSNQYLTSLDRNLMNAKRQKVIVNKEHVEFIADRAKSHWKHIARELDINESDINEIEKNSIGEQSNKLRSVLNIWLNRRNENDASFSRLISALTSCNLNKLKDEFLKAFG